MTTRPDFIITLTMVGTRPWILESEHGHLCYLFVLPESYYHGCYCRLVTCEYLVILLINLTVC